MNILFYKLLAYNELKEQADYILNSRDFEYTLENSITNYGYNPIEKLKELEDDLDSELLTSEIIDLMENKQNYECLNALYSNYYQALDYIINNRFKSYGIFITEQVYEYLSKKGY